MAPRRPPIAGPAALLLGAVATVGATVGATVVAAVAANLAATGAAQAGPLADPTRPPAALTAPGGPAAAALPHRANLDTARAIAAAARAATPPPPPAALPRLQSVQLPAQGKALALVEGRLVQVGDLLDGRAVLAIDSQGLLLQGPRGPERLWLLAGTPKQAVGSISHSQSARFQAAPGVGTAGDATAGTSAAQPLAAPAASLPDRSQAPTTPTTTSAAPGPLSLAGRTAP
ncbi:MAG: hypothetical protein QE285_16235 [Aquabacterium sp.]|nr:hypothetical protein [Aquabacterium sp.]